MNIIEKDWRQRIAGIWWLRRQESRVSVVCVGSVAKRGVRIRAYRYRIPVHCCDRRPANELAAHVVLTNNNCLRLN